LRETDPISFSLTVRKKSMTLSPRGGK